MPENLQRNPQDEQRAHNLHAEKKNRHGVEENIESKQCGRRPDHRSGSDAETHLEAVKARFRNGGPRRDEKTGTGTDHRQHLHKAD